MFCSFLDYFIFLIISLTQNSLQMFASIQVISIQIHHSMNERVNKVKMCKKAEKVKKPTWLINLKNI